MSKGVALGFAAVSSKAQVSEDKVSLEQQKADIIAWCEANDYTLLTILAVPGHSRAYFSLEEMNTALLKSGIDAAQRLIDHINARDFDVLVVRDLERLGREQSLVTQIIGLVIRRAKARIYAFGQGSGGWIDRTNYVIGGGMAAFKAGIDKERISSGRHHGIENRKERGLSTWRPPLSHKLIRNELGKGVKMVVDESRRPLLDAIRDTLLANTPYNLFPAELTRRGFPVNPSTGNPWRRDYFLTWFRRADVWGNMVTRETDLPKKAIYGDFAFDPNAPRPPGIAMRYGTHDAAWTGDDAKAIWNNLQNVRPRFAGNARPQKRHAFTGLLICSECKNPLAYHRGGQYRTSISYRCRHAYDAYYGDCTNRRNVSVHLVRRFMDMVIRAVLSSATPETYLRQSVRLAVPDRAPSIAFIRDNLDQFWQMDETAINDALVGLLGSLRIEIEGNQIGGLIPNPRPPKS